MRSGGSGSGVTGPVTSEPGPPRWWPRIAGGVVEVAEPEVMRDWRADPHPFLAVVLLLAGPEVERRRRAIARALHPWCAMTSPGQAHITLAALGRIARAEAMAALPFGRRVELQVGGADSFRSAAFLHAGGQVLADLRLQVLSSVVWEVDPVLEWVPHVTVGTYRWPLRTAEVARRLQPMREQPTLLVVGRLALVRVDRSSPVGRLVHLFPPRFDSGKMLR